MLLTLEGFMGCGKSSIGRELFRRLGWDAYDLDSLIVQRESRSIADIFASQGEAYFRKVETSVLEYTLALYDGSDLILSLGGGTPLRNAPLLKEKSCCIWLRATPETIIRHIGTSDPSRPLFGSDLRERLAERAPFYEAAARFIVDVDGKRADQVADEILAKIKI